jgi:hypothetical protein
MTLDAGKIFAGVSSIALVVLAMAALAAFIIIDPKSLATSSPPILLPLLAIGGVIVFILVLTSVAIMFSFIGLTHQDQAMGLPEGSIRAVIALSLIVLFTILAVFLYQNISRGGPVSTVENLSDAERVQFLKDHSTARDVKSVLATKDGKPLKKPDGSDLYTVTYRDENPTSADFAKQLLVLLGTLMTAITSFYLGAGTAASATAPPSPSPTVDHIQNREHVISRDGSVIRLMVKGNNLDIIRNVKIEREGARYSGSNVVSKSDNVTCEITVTAAMVAPPPWDVVVDDGASKFATLRSALTITQ